MNEDIIRFYRVGDAYGEFSNFSPYPIELDGQTWPTSEHYFQAQKFVDNEYRELVRAQSSPMSAARLGRDRTQPIRADWDEIKDSIMYAAVSAKFRQHQDLRLLLLNTGAARIVEHTENDRYWGDGGDGTGLNRLGDILMRVRDELRDESSASD